MAEGTRSIAEENKENQSCDDDVLCVESVEGKELECVWPEDEDPDTSDARDQAWSGHSKMKTRWGAKAILVLMLCFFPSEFETLFFEPDRTGGWTAKRPNQDLHRLGSLKRSSVQYNR